MYIISHLYHCIGQACIRLLSALRCRLLNVKGFGHVLIVSPHPDDEVFGCGLLIQHLIAAKKKVSIVILSQGEAVHRKCCPLHEKEVIKKRRQIALRSNRLLGIVPENIHFLDFPDSAFSSITAEQVSNLYNLIVEIAPDVIFYPHPLEYSPDHNVVTDLMKRLDTKISIKHYYYCVWVWYHMPFYRSISMKWSNAYYIKGKGMLNYKGLAIKSYMEDKAPCGVSYSGSLPKLFLKAHKKNVELFFEAK